MKLSVLTMITKPDERQDAWKEALENYLAFADEVVCVNGGPTLEFPDVKMVERPWPDDWKWQQLPEQLNFGKTHCTGDWIIKLDIDQLIHQEEMIELRHRIEEFDKKPDIHLLKLIKINFSVKRKYTAKGTQPIVFRNRPDIGFGFIEEFPEGDLCMPMQITGMGADGVPVGRTLKTGDTELHYWNLSYCFKTKEVARAHYARMCRAYREYYHSTALGTNDEESWVLFLQADLAKYMKCKETARIEQLPYQIQDAIKNLTPDQKGFDLWGLL